MKWISRHAVPGKLHAGLRVVKGAVPMEDMNQNDRMTLIRTGFTDPVAIALAGSLLQEAEIPYFVMDANVSNRQESGNVIGWWNISVPERSEDEVRAILDAVMQPNKETVPGELPPGAEANSTSS